MKKSELRAIDAAVTVQRWSGAHPPTEVSIRQTLLSEGLHPYRWSNDPEYVYAVHLHSYDKVIYIVSGSITFGLPEKEEQIELEAGDRLELGAGVSHNAVVGAKGVVCLEAHR